ncbi:histone H1-like [Arctopsyche grandis]|uniref:histone H1-like n=1 Tax=Arctopsyche grandis TaxID=121162 RepID=UPI00406DA054
MADTASPVAASPLPTTPAKKSKVAAVKKPQKKPTHPKTSEMVNNAISDLKERGGSSLQAIKKFISANYKVDADKLAPFIRKYLKGAVDSGTLVRTKGKGAAGSFKLEAKAKGAPAAKKIKAAPKKVAAAAKSPAKAAGRVQKRKPAAAKKTTAAAVKPKKAAAKKTTAAASPAKKAAKSKTPTKAKTTTKPPTKKPKAPKPKKAGVAAKSKAIKRTAAKK